MSNTCNAPRCSNDTRYKDRFIVMPHVLELKFHRPTPDEYEKVQSKLERPDYVVGKTTRLCSNHFKYGKPMPRSRLPTMFLRGYPDWAVTKENAIKTATAADGVVRETLAHMSQYLPVTIAQQLGNKYFSTPECSVSDFCQAVLQMSKERAQEALPHIAAWVYPGKVLEALATYHHGIDFDGVTKLKIHVEPLSMEVDAEPSLCTPYSIPTTHNYTQMPDMPEKDWNPVHQCGRKLTAPCSKNSCKHRMQQLSDRIKYLTSHVTELECANEELIADKKELQNELKTKEAAMRFMEEKVNSPPVSIEHICHSDQLVMLHTGLTYGHFKWVLDQVYPAASKMIYWKGNLTKDGKVTEKDKPGPPRSLSLENELLLTVMSLKLNIGNEYIAYLFGVSLK